MAESKYGPADVSRDVLLVVGGALIGAAVALLYAPQTGDRTRKQIARKIDDARDQAREYGEELLDKVDDLKHQVSKQIEAGVAVVGERKDSFLDNIASLEGKLGQLKKKIAKK